MPASRIKQEYSNRLRFALGMGALTATEELVGRRGGVGSYSQCGPLISKVIFNRLSMSI